MKGARLKFILILTIFVFAGILFYFLWPKKWQTYQNSRYNFSVEYPAGWQLGERETNNAGRTFREPKSGVECYAYGFANALENEEGQPQTLNEFIDWLISNASEGDHGMPMAVLERKATKMGNLPAVYLLTGQDMNIQESVYVLGTDYGIGLICNYKNLEERKRYQKIFSKMVASIKIFADLNAEESIAGTEECQNLLNGVVEPLKDLQIFEDEQYPEVTVTSRESWDKNKLPKQVLTLEDSNYQCYPMPLKFEESRPEPGMNVEPAVKEVRWQCELKYQIWQYLAAENLTKKGELEKEGYSCKKESCFKEGTEMGDIWLCTK